MLYIRPSRCNMSVSCKLLIACHALADVRILRLRPRRRSSSWAAERQSGRAPALVTPFSLATWMAQTSASWKRVIEVCPKESTLRHWVDGDDEVLATFTCCCMHSDAGGSTICTWLHGGMIFASVVSVTKLLRECYDLGLWG